GVNNPADLGLPVEYITPSLFTAHQQFTTLPMTIKLLKNESMNSTTKRKKGHCLNRFPTKRSNISSGP
ncbi:hypothetical protein, partial [Mariprofundus erugo]|uniref:hypothetical protein n=1 Tax=Mariprofundus erugo TaxID=2528639 RepID=UPI001EE8BF5D